MGCNRWLKHMHVSTPYISQSQPCTEVTRREALRQRVVQVASRRVYAHPCRGRIIGT